jgi:hypothetical protein
VPMTMVRKYNKDNSITNIIEYVGSGVSAVLEIFRVLVESGIKFNRTIQFMTYAAEEGS